MLNVSFHVWRNTSEKSMILWEDIFLANTWTIIVAISEREGLCWADLEFTKFWQDISSVKRTKYIDENRAFFVNLNKLSIILWQFWRLRKFECPSKSASSNQRVWTCPARFDLMSFRTFLSYLVSFAFYSITERAIDKQQLHNAFGRESQRQDCRRQGLIRACSDESSTWN